jgi:hypothetical protein
VQSIKIYYTGKRAKTGGLCYDDRGRLQVFVAYCDNCHNKVIMDLREAEDFAYKWHTSKRQNKHLFNKLYKIRT